MVLTQRSGDYMELDSYWRFHTTMVLTQRKTGSSSERPDGFHTTMVLTQRDEAERGYHLPVCVSIPLWFLRNEIVKIGISQLRFLFPYHYGSYATCSWCSVT